MDRHGHGGEVWCFWRRKPPFAGLYREHSREVYNWFRKETRDHKVAADLTAETCLLAVRRWFARAP